MAKRKESLVRVSNRRQRNKTILIVGEGETEQAYFMAIRHVLRSPSLIIVIDINTKNDPLSIVSRATRLYKTKDYIHVFCVFDGDQASSKPAKQKLAKYGNDLRAFVSIPCFETWLGLHFSRLSAPMDNCNHMERYLVQQWHDYRKGCDCSPLMERRLAACENAHWLEQQSLDNPSTDLHHLIELLDILFNPTHN